MAKKIIVIIFGILVYNACSVSNFYYSYYPVEEIKTLAIKGTIKNDDSESSPLSNISIEDKRNLNGKKHKLTLLNNSIKLVKDGKEYIVPYSNSNSNNYEDIYVYIYKNGVNIINGDFIAYIGKVKLDTGEIINIPPLHFKKEVLVEKYNPILDTLNQNTTEKIFDGPMEDYEKKRKKY